MSTRLSRINTSARTGNHASSVRTIPITYVQFFVPGISQVLSGQFQLLTYSSSYRESRKFRPDNSNYLRTTSSYRDTLRFRPDNSNYLRTVLRTGNLASSVRTIPITYVQFFVPGISQVPSGQFPMLP